MHPTTPTHPGIQRWNAPAVAVIIPFYQEQTGILRRAVESALAQEGVPNPHLVIIDDGSPVDPRAELADLLPRHAERLEILKQANAGPAAARNTGIRHVRGRADIVSFLDSDDIWAATHLKSALAALAQGYDFYFCDAVHRRSERTIFETKSFPDVHARRLPSGDHIYRYDGDFLQLILDNCPIQTSTTAFRLQNISALYREELRTAGEDYSFWLEIAYAGSSVAFSTDANVRLGEGVNIYASVEWATNAAILQTYYNQLYVARLIRHFDLSASQKASCRRLTTTNRQKMAENVFSMIARRRSMDLSVVMRYLMMDPFVAVRFVCHAAGRIKRMIGEGRESRRAVSKKQG